MKSVAWTFLALLITASIPALAKTTYFSCTVTEMMKKSGKTEVTVKFAVEDLDMYKKNGELIQYPGSDEDAGMISVSPQTVKEYYTKMSNLNSQGGDLRIEGHNLRLWGDGDGYQFTDLVIWDVDDEEENLEGYVRDYGPAYGDAEIFKQFIKCRQSDQVL